MLSEMKTNSSDYQFIWTGNFLPSSVNSKRYAPAIFGMLVCKLPLQSGGIALFVGLFISA